MKFYSKVKNSPLKGNVYKQQLNTSRKNDTDEQLRYNQKDTCTKRLIRAT